jgi:SAM-dependent methyltransferase
MEQVRMARSRILLANCYDYPQYYDIAFQAYTRWEADFIEAACRKYCPFYARRLLEPACGSGRLITELAARGYDVTGFDVSQPALNYLRRRLTRRRLNAEIFDAEMSDFRLSRSVDAAYCTLNTFRHLLTERTARGHLECVAESLRPGGIYILGLHLLPLARNTEDVWRWTEQRGKTRVTAALRVLRTNVRTRVVDFRASLLVRQASSKLRLRHEFQLRTYTTRQFRRLLRSIPSLKLCGTYDFRYGIERQFALNDETAYRIFVLRRQQS